MLAETAFVGLHQTHLTDCRSGLQIVYRNRTGAPAQALHTFCNCAGRHQHHLMSAGVERSDLARPIAQRAEIQSRTLIRHQAAAYLDDDTLALGQYGFHVCSKLEFPSKNQPPAKTQRRKDAKKSESRFAFCNYREDIEEIIRWLILCFLRD